MFFRFDLCCDDLVRFLETLINNEAYAFRNGEQRGLVAVGYLEQVFFELQQRLLILSRRVQDQILQAVYKKVLVLPLVDLGYHEWQVLLYVLRS